MLCEVCQEHIVNLARPTAVKGKAIELGTFGEIFCRKERCDFCFLVVQAFQQLAHHDKISKLCGEACRITCWKTPSKFGVRLNSEAGDSFHRSYGHAEILRVARPVLAGTASRWCYRPLQRDPINQPLFVDWRRLCRNFHGDRCADPKWLKLSVPTELKLINVVQRTISLASENVAYAALSYVWGTNMPTEHVSTEATLKNLPTSLPDDCELPQSIKDAMLITKSLGLTYLWVDAICIAQHPSENIDKAHHLAQMDTIFKAAEVVIAAAASQHASLGMLNTDGVIRRNIIRHIDGVEFAVAQPDVELACQRSVWAQRAWTFQENLLARRILIVGRFESQWLCQCAQWRESIICEQDVTSSHADTTRPPQRVFDLLKESVPWEVEGAVNTLKAYTKVVHQYTARALGRPDDGLNAVQGVLNMLQIFDNRWIDMHFGLPAVFFDPALLWRPLSYARRSPSLKWAGKIPSWSWAGWVDSTNQGMCWDEDELFGVWGEKIQVQPALEWFVLQENGQSVSLPPHERHEKDWDFPDIQRLPCGMSSACDPSDPPPRDSMTAVVPGYYLHFLTTTSKCYLGPEILIPERGVQPLSLYTLFTSNGELAGHIELAPSHAQEVRCSKQPLDLIFLSYSRIPIVWYLMVNILQLDDEGKGYPPWFGFNFEQASLGLRHYSAINALWVERGNNGTVERIQKAHCVLKAWENNDPITEWIVLG